MNVESYTTYIFITQHTLEKSLIYDIIKEYIGFFCITSLNNCRNILQLQHLLVFIATLLPIFLDITFTAQKFACTINRTNDFGCRKWEFRDL